MRSSPAAGVFFSTNQCRACQIGQCSNLAITQAGVDVLTLASTPSGYQCSHDGIGCVQSRSQVSDRYADLDWRTVSGARDMHQAKLGLDHDVVASPIAVRAGLAISGDTRIDQLWIDRTERLVVHLVLLKAPGHVILHENIALLNEFMQDVYSGLVGEGEAD